MRFSVRFVFAVLVAGLFLNLAPSFRAFSANGEDSLKVLVSKATVDTVKIDLLLKLCDLYSGRDLTLAQEFCDEAVALATKNKSYRFLFPALQKSGKICFDAGNFDKAVSFVLKYKDLAEQNKNELDIAMSYADYGVCMSLTQENEKAEEYLLKSLAYFDSKKDDQRDTLVNSRMVLLYSNLGILFLAKGDSVKAAKFNTRGIEIGEKNRINSTFFIKLLNSHSFLLVKQRNFDEALQYIRMAIRLSEENHDNYSLGISFNMLALYNTAMGNYAESYRLLNRSLILADSARSTSLRGGTYQVLFHLFENWGPRDSILKYHQLYDLSLKELKNQEASNMVTRYEVAKEYQYKEEKMQASFQTRTYLYLASFALFVFLVLIVFIVRGYRKRPNDPYQSN